MTMRTVKRIRRIGEQQSGVEFVLELEVNQNEVVMAGAGVTAPAQSINTQARYGYPVRQSEPRRAESIAIQWFKQKIRVLAEDNYSVCLH